MPADSKHFGDLLTDLFQQIKDAGGGTIGHLQDTIGQRIGKRGGDSLAKWRQGKAVARQQDVEGLVRELELIRRERAARLPPEQFHRDLFDLLMAADHPYPDEILARLAQPTSVLQSSRVSQPSVDWGRSPDVASFAGREQELAQLHRWLTHDRCRLVGVFGLGGIGKTFLSKKAAQVAAPAFVAMKWVLLQDGPPLDDVLAECIHFFSHFQDTGLPTTIAGRINRLLDYFRRQRCLLIFDKLEAVMRPGQPAGLFREGYTPYGDFIQAVAEAEHRSCLVVVSREQPRDMARWDTQPRRVVSLPLKGVSVLAAQDILQEAGFTGTATDWDALVAHYAGNPLMLQLTAAPIRDLYAGRLGNFLAEERFAFGDVNDLLDEHFVRLSAAEQDVMHWLAVERTALSVDYLEERLLPRQPIGEVRTILSSLLRRHLVDRDPAGFFLQDIILEYVTNHLVTGMAAELTTGRADLFQRVPLLNPAAAEHKRLSQERFLVAPLLEPLRQAWPRETLVEQLLRLVVADRAARRPGYTAGNCLNLLRAAQADLTGADFSQVSIWRACLQDVALHDVNLAGADLRETWLAEPFSSVAALALSRDGARLAVGVEDGDVFLWRCRDFKRLLTLKGHNDWVRGVAFSPDGRLLASASSDKKILLWDAETGDCLHTLIGHTGRVRLIDFSPNGQLLASASSDKTVRLWRVADGRLLRTLDHTESAYAVRFDATGQLLASSGYGESIRLWEVETGECLRILTGHTGPVMALAFHPIHEYLLASGSDDKTVRLWDVRAGACLHICEGHQAEVLRVAFSPDGRWLASGSHDRCVRVWRMDTYAAFRLFEGHHDVIEAVAFAPGADTPLLYVGSHDQSIHVWDVHGAQRVRTVQGYQNRAWTVAWHPQRPWVASGSSDGHIRIWDLDRRQCVHDLTGHTAWIEYIAFSPNGDRLVSGSPDKTVRLWDTRDGRPLQSHRQHSQMVGVVAFHPHGWLVASGGEDSSICLWNLEGGYSFTRLQHPNSVRGLAFSAEGRWLASSDDAGTIRVWDAHSWQLVFDWQTAAAVWGLAFDLRGERLASGSHDGTMRLWDMTSGACVQTWQAHEDAIDALAYHPLAGLLASASHDGSVRLWDADTGTLVRRLQSEDRVSGIAFSPDGRRLAAGGRNEVVRIWDWATATVVQELICPRPYDGLNITGVTGLTNAQVRMLKQLGAVEAGLARPMPYSDDRRRIEEASATT